MNEESFFDFEQEIMDHYANKTEEELFYDDCSQGSVDAESYDP
jgi:hypothetical protein